MNLLKSILHVSFILFFACKADRKSESVNNLSKITLKYAKGFDIEYAESYKVITVHDPWQGATAIDYKYFLIDKDSEYKDFETDWTVIKTPVERVICLSTTHIAFIDVLNKTNTIIGVSGANYVNNKNVRKKIENNNVVDIGYDNSLNYELIASINPDLVITYGIGSQVASYNQKLNDLGIQTIINAEYLENHPLGKLEWIKFMAAFYNLDDQATIYFDQAEKDYNELLSLVENVDKKPKVLFGLPWKDTWYVPGGQSYLAKMVSDAGGEYIWKDNESRESLPFDIESIFSQASQTDIWLNAGTINSKADILKIDERFLHFSPFNRSSIFNNNLRMNEYGGNDYWESGLVEPQTLLRDMIKIIHPELLSDHKLVYYKEIE